MATQRKRNWNRYGRYSSDLGFRWLKAHRFGQDGGSNLSSTESPLQASRAFPMAAHNPFTPPSMPTQISFKCAVRDIHFAENKSSLHFRIYYTLVIENVRTASRYIMINFLSFPENTMYLHLHHNRSHKPAWFLWRCGTMREKIGSWVCHEQ